MTALVNTRLNNTGKKDASSTGADAAVDNTAVSAAPGDVVCVEMAN